MAERTATRADDPTPGGPSRRRQADGRLGETDHVKRLWGSQGEKERVGPRWSARRPGKAEEVLHESRWEAGGNGQVRREWHKGLRRRRETRGDEPRRVVGHEDDRVAAGAPEPGAGRRGNEGAEVDVHVCGHPSVLEREVQVQAVPSREDRPVRAEREGKVKLSQGKHAASLGSRIEGGRAHGVDGQGEDIGVGQAGVHREPLASAVGADEHAVDPRSRMSVLGVSGSTARAWT